MSFAHEVTKLRKEGHIDEAYTKGCEFLSSNPDDESVKGALGWVLYEKVKGLVNESKNRPSSNKKVPNKKASEALRNVLRDYARLRLSRPDLLFSLLLSQVLQFPDEMSFLPKFMIWAGTDSFRSEDFQEQSASDGKKYKSLVEKTAKKVGKVSRNITAQDPDIQEIHRFSIRLIDLAIEKASLQEPEWLQYHKALLLHSLGDSRSAQDALLPFVRRKRTEYWAWEALADVVESDDPNEAIALYVKACLSCKDEAFGVKVFQKLGYLAAQQDEIALSKWAENRAFQVLNQKGWSISPPLSNLLKEAWYADKSIPMISKEALSRMALDAEVFIQASLPRYAANYLGSFTSKGGKRLAKFGTVVDGEPQELIGSSKHLLSSFIPVIGEPLTITVDAAGERLNIVTVNQRQEGKPFDSLHCITGEFQLHPKGYGFVDKVYIPHEVAESIDDRCHVSVAVVRKLNRKKNQWGLTAVAVVNDAVA